MVARPPEGAPRFRTLRWPHEAEALGVDAEVDATDALFRDAHALDDVAARAVRVDQDDPGSAQRHALGDLREAVADARGGYP